MKLYDANAGNPKRVRIFIAEKKIDIPREILELGTDTRSEEFLKINPNGEVPALELSDGQVITETYAVCQYLEAKFPERPLMGVTPEDKGRIAMHSQRIHSHLFMTLGLIVRHEVPLFADVLEQVPEFAQSLRRAVPDKWAMLEKSMSDERSFIAGETFTFADVEGMAALTIADAFGLGPSEACKNVQSWASNMRDRPSWNA
jgi:glutathione S-transferase